MSILLYGWSEMDRKGMSTVEREFAENAAETIEFTVLTKDDKIETQVNEILKRYGKQNITFGQALRKCMKKCNMTIAKLAEKTGICDRHIGRMRRDQVKDIKFSTIIALCIALNLATETAEKLLNIKRYSLYCDEPYVQLCNMFIRVRISISKCNEILISKGYEPLIEEANLW